MKRILLLLTVALYISMNTKVQTREFPCKAIVN